MSEQVDHNIRIRRIPEIWMQCPKCKEFFMIGEREKCPRCHVKLVKVCPYCKKPEKRCTCLR